MDGRVRVVTLHVRVMGVSTQRSDVREKAGMSEMSEDTQCENTRVSECVRVRV